MRTGKHNGYYIKVESVPNKDGTFGSLAKITNETHNIYPPQTTNNIIGVQDNPDPKDSTIKSTAEEAEDYGYSQAVALVDESLLDNSCA